MAEFVSACTEREDLGGGRFRHVQHIKPIAYERNGVLRRATNVLAATGAEKMSVGVDELAQFRVCPRIARDEPLIHFGSKASFVQLTPVSANEVAGDVRDNVITFLGAWPGADLVYTNGGHILHEDIVLGKDHPTRFQFLISNSAGLDRENLTTPDFRIVAPVLTKDGEPDGILLKWQKTDDHGKMLLTCELPKGDWTGWTIDPTLTLQPNAAAGKDAEIYGTNPTFNYGTYNRLIGATSITKGLIRFDLSSIPSGSICTSAVLYLYQMASGAANAWTVSIYSIAIGNTAWIEGTRNAVLALAGEPCWNALAADGAGGVLTPWAGSAGLSTAITDYEAIAIGSFNGNRSNPNGTEYSTALTAARVQGWFGATNMNYGALPVAPGNIGGIASSDHATADRRPKLVTTYTLPGGGIFNPTFAGTFRGAFG